MNHMRQPAIEKNQVIEVEIIAMTHEGDGIAKVDGFALFIPNTVEGDLAKILVVKVKKQYGYGKLLELITPSQKRVASTCAVFPRCGGCHLRHINYSAQLEWKRKSVADNLERIGKIKGAEVLPALGMDEPAHYRNKAQYPVRKHPQTGETTIGFYAKNTHHVVEHEDCEIGHAENMMVVKLLKQFMAVHRLSAYDEETGKGLIRHMVLRTSQKGEWMVVLVTNGTKLPYADAWVQLLCDQLPQVKSIYQNIHEAQNNVVLGNKNVLLWGEPYLFDTIGKLNFRISPHSFFQVNAKQTEKLYEKALEYANLSGDEVVFDLYCGIGSISLFLAQKAKQVIGIEIVPEAVEDAKDNATLNNIQNVSFYTGAAEEIAPQLVKQGVLPHVVVVDPPRKGCDEKLLQLLIDLKPEKIVYVSCNPASLARDAGMLCENGYQVEKVQPVDMFPHTAHVETVVLLSHKNADSFISVKMDYDDNSLRVPDRVTYAMIQEYVQQKYNYKVHTAYIAEVKRSLGLQMYEAPNRVDELKHPYKPAPAHKVEAIKDALKHFGVI